MKIHLHENTGTATIGDTVIEFTWTPRRAAVLADDPRHDDPPEDASVRVDYACYKGDGNECVPAAMFDDLGLLETLEERILNEMRGEGLV